jgi:hypothetical protein
MKDFRDLTKEEKEALLEKGAKQANEKAAEKKDFWDEMDSAMEEAAKKAIDETHAAGRPSYHGDGKGEYYLYPDGHKEYVKLYKEK